VIGASSRFLVQSNAPIKDIAYHNTTSTLFWITAKGVSQSNIGRQTLIYKINDVMPSGLALDTITGNIYYSAFKNGTSSDQYLSVIRVISKFLKGEVNIITALAVITDIALDNQNGLLFWSECNKPDTGRIVRSTMDGRTVMWLYEIDEIVCPTSIVVDPIKSRIYWADIILQSISSSDYNGINQRREVEKTNGQPTALTFFENSLTWSLSDQDVLYSHVINGNFTSQHKLHKQVKVNRLITVHSVLEPESPNHCALSPCNEGICILKNSSKFTCHCPAGSTVLSVVPFKCSGGSCPRYFFQCRPDLKCHSRKLVCAGDAVCRKLSVKSLCERLKSNKTTRAYSLTSETLREMPSSTTTPKLTTQHALHHSSDFSNAMPSFEKASIRLCSQDGQVVAEDFFSQIEETLQAVLDGPVHVLSRLFTKKGHNIGKSLKL
jgi:hypothetical protein